MISPAIQNTINFSQDRMNKEKMMLSLRYHDLCIKADPVALLNIEVNTGGGTLRLEDCADVIIPSWNQFQMFVRQESDLSPIVKAVRQEHPEFKLELVPSMAYEGQTEEENSLLYTMPPVNKERRDFLLNAVDVLYGITKARFEKIKADTIGGVTLALKDAPQDLKEATDAVDSMCESQTEALLKVRTDKEAEIEAAYAEYVAEHGEEADMVSGGKGSTSAAGSTEVDNEEDMAYSMSVESWKNI